MLGDFLDSEHLKDLSADFCPRLTKAKEIGRQSSPASSLSLQQTPLSFSMSLCSFSRFIPMPKAAIPAPRAVLAPPCPPEGVSL